MAKNSKAVLVSLSDLAKIYFFAVIEGALCLLSLFISKLWKRNSSDEAYFRKKPPECLNDYVLGNHSYIKIKGVKFHFVESGTKESPPLILLHGFPDSWIAWRHQIPVLAKHYRVIAIDLKGMGESDKPQSCSAYSVKKLMAELHSLVSTFTTSPNAENLKESRQAVIIGHGLGALIGWHYLISNPTANERVSKFIAIGAPHPNLYWTQAPSKSINNTRWVGLCQIPVLAEFKCMADDMSFINSCHSYLSPSIKQQSLMLDAYKYLFARFEDWRGAINYFRTLPLTRLKETKGFRLNIPTLLIASSEDPSVSLTAIVSSTDFLDNHRVKIINATSHFPHQEKPDIVNSVLLDFLIDQPESCKEIDAADRSSNSLMLRMFGAVSSTVNSIQKRTSDIKTRALSLRAPTG